MGCRSCAEARNRVTSQARSGNVLGVAKALTAGAVMMSEKLMGVDIEKKYGSADAAQKKPYVRD